MTPSDRVGPPSDSDPHGTKWSRRALAHDRLIRAALSLNEAFDLRRTYEDAPPAREFVLACQVVRDIDRTGEWESDAT